MKILNLEVHKGINARHQSEVEDCNYMLHIVGDIVDVSTGNYIVGLTIDNINKKAIKQTISKDWTISYHVYENNKHYEIIKKGIYENIITIEDIMLIAKGE